MEDSPSTAVFAGTDGGRPLVTTGLLGVNVAVFLLMMLGGVPILNPTPEQLLAWGADYGPRTLSGEWWRLATAMFVHVGAIHIAFNMWCLWELGGLLERLVGPPAFGWLYLFSGVAGSVVSLAVHPTVVSAGASGAVFGVAGGLLVVLRLGHVTSENQHTKRALGSVATFVVYNLLGGAAESGIDNAAHVGGLLMGALSGGALVLARVSSPWRRFSLAVAAVLTAFVAVGAAGLPALHPALRDITAARELMSRGEREQAIARLEPVVRTDSTNAEAQALLGAMYFDEGRYERAIPHLEATLALDSRRRKLAAYLALAYHLTERSDSAIRVLERAAADLPRDADVHDILATVYRETGRYDSALVAYQRTLALDPGRQDALQGLGFVYYRLERYVDAVAAFDTALGHPLPDPNGYYYRAASHDALGNAETARRDFLTFLRVGADPDLQARAGERVRVLDPSRQVRLRGVVTDLSRLNPPPRRYLCPDLPYPDTLARAGVRGRVVLEFVVDTGGLVEESSIEAVEADDWRLVSIAWNMVAQCGYEPGRRNGRPVRALVRETVEFPPRRR